jgi:hypothetical protein
MMLTQTVIHEVIRVSRQWRVEIERRKRLLQHGKGRRSQLDSSVKLDENWVE